MHLDLRSALFREEYVSPRIQQHALLHLVHPDTFEPIVSINHKEMIVAAFERLVENPEQDIDRKLQEIRGHADPGRRVVRWAVGSGSGRSIVVPRSGYN